MDSLKYKKQLRQAIIIGFILMLTGCASSSKKTTVKVSSAPLPARASSSAVKREQINTSPYIASPQNIETGGESGNVRDSRLTSDSTCIEQLDSLRKLSPSDYNPMVNEFKKISKINAMYRNLQGTTNKDVLTLLRMSIESKAEVQCAKVRYISVMAVNSALKELDK